MYNNFSDEYKKLMIDTENRVKTGNFPEILPEDVFLELMKSTNGMVFDIFSSYGINQKIVNDVFLKRPFAEFRNGAGGPYIGLSTRVKDLILISVKIAASFEKQKAGIEDFLLALLRTPKETWIVQFLDFVGVSPKDFEAELVKVSRESQKNKGDAGMFAPLDGILNALESNMNEAQDMNNPFFANKKQEGKKNESTTPALDFFGHDLTEQAKQGKIDPIIGREGEIERLISILNRKTKNNPCLVGEPGVGKTAVIE